MTDTKRYPFYDEPIRASARKCRFCGIVDIERHSSRGGAMSNDRQPMEFRGTGGDCFAFLITRLLLTGVTFGLYIPWRIVGKQKWIAEHSYVAQGTDSSVVEPDPLEVMLAARARDPRTWYVLGGLTAAMIALVLMVGVVTTVVDVVSDLVGSREEVSVSEPSGSPDHASDRASYNGAQLSVTDANASTWNRMDRDPARYNPDNVLDDQLDTAWCKLDGVGDYINIVLASESEVDHLTVRNGYQKVKNDKYGDRFYHNSRVHQATLTFSDGTTKVVYLSDKKENQDIDAGGAVTRTVQLRVESAYYGSDHSICLTEIDVFGKPLPVQE